ncbi:hypothetical protein KBC40_00800 [Patescibacteria group bacterium]|nr:hypothetical protein [Patescibacteria group bacterium]
MSFQELQNLSSAVKDIIFSDNLTDQNLRIADKFALNQSQLDFILDLEEKIWLKIISPLDLPKELEQMERSEYYDLRALSLELALNILWPLQQYLGEVDRLILRLGAKVPRLQVLQTEPLVNKSLPNSVKGAIKFLLEQYPDLQDKRLSANKIILEQNRRVQPTLANWLGDYVHFLGAGFHDSLERSRYLAQSPNVLALSEKEKENLRYFLLSYDDNVAVELFTDDAVLRFVMLDEVAEIDAEKEKALSWEEILQNFADKIEVLKGQILSDGLVLSEAENSLYKLRDILWQALALQDQAKVLSCLKILLSKSALDLLLVEDRRFKGLLRRFVDLKFGENMRLDEQDKLLSRRLFLEMILSAKLQLASEQGVLAAFYLTNLNQASGQVVYLDKKNNQLKWRELIVMNNKIVWQDNF